MIFFYKNRFFSGAVFLCYKTVAKFISKKYVY
jgi:hypothetical protein